MMQRFQQCLLNPLRPQRAKRRNAVGVESVFPVIGDKSSTNTVAHRTSLVATSIACTDHLDSARTSEKLDISFEKKPKLQFAKSVDTYIITPRDKISCDLEELFWSSEEVCTFRNESMKEVKALADQNKISLKEAASRLYQPEFSDEILPNYGLFLNLFCKFRRVYSTH